MTGRVLLSCLSSILACNVSLHTHKTKVAGTHQKRPFLIVFLLVVLFTLLPDQIVGLAYLLCFTRGDLNHFLSFFC